MVDTGKTGHHCIQIGAKTLLWRPGHSKATRLTLENVDDGSKAVVDWPSRTRTLTWPARIKFKDGGNYKVHLEGVPTSRRFVLHLLPEGLRTDAHRAARMFGKGCERQSRQLLAKAAIAAARVK